MGFHRVKNSLISPERQLSCLIHNVYNLVASTHIPTRHRVLGLHMGGKSGPQDVTNLNHLSRISLAHCISLSISRNIEIY